MKNDEFSPEKLTKHETIHFSDACFYPFLNTYGHDKDKNPEAFIKELEKAVKEAKEQGYFDLAVCFEFKWGYEDDTELIFEIKGKRIESDEAFKARQKWIREVREDKRKTELALLNELSARRAELEKPIE